MSASDEDVLLLKALIAYNAGHDEKDRISDLTGPNKEKVLDYYYSRNPSVCIVRGVGTTAGGGKIIFKRGENPDGTPEFTSNKTEYSEYAFRDYFQHLFQKYADDFLRKRTDDEDEMSEEDKLFLLSLFVYTQMKPRETKHGEERVNVAIYIKFIGSKNSTTLSIDATPERDESILNRFRNAFDSFLLKQSALSAKVETEMKKPEAARNLEHETMQGFYLLSLASKEEIINGASAFLQKLISFKEDFQEQEIANRSNDDDGTQNKRSKTGNDGKEPSAPRPFSKGKAPTKPQVSIKESIALAEDPELAEIREQMARLKEKEAQLVQAKKAQAVAESSSAAAARAVAPSRPVFPRATTAPAPAPKTAKLPAEGTPYLKLVNDMTKFQQIRWLHSMLGSDGVVRVMTPETKFAEKGQLTLNAAIHWFCKVAKPAERKSVIDRCPTQAGYTSAETAAPEMNVNTRDFVMRISRVEEGAKKEYAELFKGSLGEKEVPPEKEGGKPTKAVLLLKDEDNAIFKASEGVFDNKIKFVEWFIDFLKAYKEDGEAAASRFLDTMKHSVERTLLLQSADVSAWSKLDALFQVGFIEETFFELTKAKLVVCMRAILEAMPGAVGALVATLEEKKTEKKEEKEAEKAVKEGRPAPVRVKKHKTSRKRHAPSGNELKYYFGLPVLEIDNKFALLQSEMRQYSNPTRIMRGMFLLLLQQEGAIRYYSEDEPLGEKDLQQRILDVMQNIPIPAEEDDRATGEYAFITRVLVGLASIEHPEELDVDTLIFHDKLAEDEKAALSRVFQELSASLSLLFWLFIAASQVFFIDDASHTAALNNVMNYLVGLKKIMPKKHFSGVKMDKVVRNAFQKYPFDFTTQQRRVISYTFQNHIVLERDPNNDSLEVNPPYETVDKKAEERIARYKSKRSGLSKAKAVYAGVAIDDIEEKNKSTEWLRGIVAKVLGRDNHLENTYKMLKSRKNSKGENDPLKFYRPHAIGLLLEMFEAPYNHLANAEEEADMDDSQKKQRRVKKMAKIIALMKKGSLKRLEEDMYGSVPKPEYTPDQAETIWNYNHNTYAEQGKYQGRAIESRKQLAEINKKLKEEGKEEIRIQVGELNIFKGVEFGQNEALALRNIMVEKGLFPPTEFISLWNNPKQEIKGMDLTVEVKKRVLAKMSEIWKSNDSAPKGEQIGYTVEGLQSALTMLNLLKALNKIKVKQYKELLEACMYAESLENTNESLKTALVEFRTRDAQGQGNTVVLRKEDAKNLIIAARARVNHFIAIHNSKYATPASEKDNEAVSAGQNEDDENLSQQAAEIGVSLAVLKEIEKEAENEIEGSGQKNDDDKANIIEDEEDEEEDEDEDEDDE